MRSRRTGGALGFVVIAGYLVLRLGFVAYREHEEGVSTLGIVETVLAVLVGVFLITQIVQWVHRSRAASRDRTLAGMHPGAYLVPVTLKRDLVGEAQRLQDMLGLTRNRLPRSGTATLVADGNGLGLYVGGEQPQLVVGLARAVVRHVGTGTTRAGGRYAIGHVASLQVFVSNGQHWTTLDLPVYERVVGYPRSLRGAALDQVVKQVSAASGVALAPTPTP